VLDIDQGGVPGSPAESQGFSIHSLWRFLKIDEFRVGETPPFTKPKKRCQSKNPHNERQNGLSITSERQTIRL